MMISKRYQINSVSEKRERRGNVNTGGPVFAKSREERDYGRSKIYGRKELRLRRDFPWQLRHCW